LDGKHPEAAILRAAAAHVAEGVEPLSDVYASGEYRAELARVHTRRALEKALGRAKN
jgi:carbon-monoxide dehydrogenase medium subunit